MLGKFFSLYGTHAARMKTIWMLHGVIRLWGFWDSVDEIRADLEDCLNHVFTRFGLDGGADWFDPGFDGISFTKPVILNLLGELVGIRGA